MKKFYNKLVRDRMIDIYKHDVDNAITASGYETKYLSTKETLEKLKDKLHEEVGEVLESYDMEDTAKLKEELADVLEVIDAILFHKNASLQEVIAIKEIKKENKGGFEKGLYLESMDYLDKE